MYDEFDRIDDNSNQRVDGGMGPDPSTEPEVHDFAETGENAEETCFSNTEDSQEEIAFLDEEEAEYQEAENRQQQESSGFYRYQYNRNGEPERRQETPVTPKQQGKRPLWKSMAICASMALVFGTVSSAAFQITDYVGSKIAPRQEEVTLDTTDTVAPPAAENDAQDLKPVSTNGYTDITQVAKNAMPSIVAITNRGVEEVQSMFFGRTYQQQTESAGSGVIIAQNDTELLVVSNNHVVEGAQELSVCFSVDAENPEDAVVKAQIKGTDPSHDLAVVAVKLSDIPDEIKKQIKVVKVGNSDDLQVGQQVVAIGNALGYGQSVTVGYVSALNREVTVDDVTNNLIQTDAAINFGNSGGALLNTSGELIGINSVKAASAGVEGMGYAIPMETAQPILNELMNRKTRTEVDASEIGYMGVVPRDVSEEAKEVYNMPAGAFIYEVSEGSPAEAAGIKKGDIITKLDNQTVSSRDELFDRMSYYKAGETIDVVVATAEGGEYTERTVSVTLGKRPAEENTVPEKQVQPQENYDEMPQEGYNGQNGSGNGYAADPFEQFFGDFFGQ